MVALALSGTQWSAIGSGAAALAALASWASVAQARQAINAGVLPDMHVEPVALGRLQLSGAAESDQERRMEYVVHNAGAGIAKAVAVVLFTDAQYVAGYLGLGLVRPGETYRVRTPMIVKGLSVPASGVIAARDVRQRGYVWDVQGGRPRRVRFRRRREPPSLADLFHMVYPGVDLKRLEKVGFGIELVNDASF